MPTSCANASHQSGRRHSSPLRPDFQVLNALFSSMNDGHLIDGFGSHVPAVHATTG
ncbi:hypothetical protein [Actinopolymorpha pittospori]